jgi:hypothetical protein
MERYRMVCVCVFGVSYMNVYAFKQCVCVYVDTRVYLLSVWRMLRCKNGHVQYISTDSVGGAQPEEGREGRIRPSRVHLRE